MLAALVMGTVSLHGQSRTPSKVYEPADAREHYKYGNYLMAMKVYRELLKTDPNNEEYNHHLGICYLRTNINKAAAIPYLEKTTKNPKADDEVWLDLGRAYHYAHRFDDAIKTYNKYKQLVPKDSQKIDRFIEMCNNGKQLVKFPVDITFQNLGKEVNSEFPDYYPFVTDDETILLFTSRKSGNIGNQLEVDGYYSSDIYMSEVKNGVWQKPKNVGTLINTRFDEQVVGLTGDGQQMLVYIDHIDSLGNIYLSEKKTSYGKIMKLNNSVNLGLETSGCISPEGDLLFFASERDGGQGETDIYMSRKLPNGKWALPQNLGPTVNTPYKEDFPRLANDGKTLYFSSQGHSSMGDFDLFKTVWDEETNSWSAPQNLGYPLNTADDDRQICITNDQRAAYISRTIDGGMGDLDLYRVRFNQTEKRVTIVTGFVLTGDTTAAGRRIDCIVNVVNAATPDALPLSYTPIPHSGKYVMALPPGKWIISIDAEGFKPFMETIILHDLGSFQPELKKDFKLLRE